MRTFNTVNKIFLKSDNNTTKIFNRYLYSLIPFILLILVYNLFWGDKIILFNLCKCLIISIGVGIITGYICNLIKKEKCFKRLFLKDHILIISLIVGLFTYNDLIVLNIVAVMVSVIARMVLKNTTISSSLYGIFIVLIINLIGGNMDTPLINLSKLSYVDSFENIYGNYGNVLSYILGYKYYLSPILSIVAFLYLFLKKSIKYNIVVAYLITFSFIMLVYGIFNNMNTWYLLFQLCTGNILFLAVFCLTDYPNTPIVYEGQLVYGIVLGIISAILRFIVPEVAVVLSMCLGSLVISKLIDKISIRMKYNNKLFYTLLGVSFLITLITSIALVLIF